MASTPVLKCHGLRRRFGDLVAVDGLGFQIAVGETYGLLGPLFGPLGGRLERRIWTSMKRYLVNTPAPARPRA